MPDGGLGPDGGPPGPAGGRPLPDDALHPASAGAAALVYVSDLERPVPEADDAHHLSRVLRLRPGQPVVAADGQGYRVLSTSQSGSFGLPPDLALQFPAIMHLRLYGMNANGKVYEVDTGCGLVK